MKHKILRRRYTLKGRIKSAIHTYNETNWTDGYKFSLKERIKRAIGNFKDMPSCSCPNYCIIHKLRN